MGEKCFQVVYNCKNPKCNGVIVDSEFDTQENAANYLQREMAAKRISRFQKPKLLLCDQCRRSYPYEPEKDKAFVRTKPTETDEERVQVF